MTEATEPPCTLEVIRLVRAFRGLSLKTVADRAGVSATYLQKLERGQVKSPSPHRLLKLADVLNFPYARLMELAGYVPPDTSPSNDSRANELPQWLTILGDVFDGADISPDEAEWWARSIKLYREAWADGVRVPPEFLTEVVSTYRRVQKAGGAIRLDELVQPGVAK